MTAKQAWLGAPAHILLAEDDRELRALLGQLLRNDGHVVTELADGWALHQRISDTREPPIDLLLSDVRMPGPSVFSTLVQTRLREMPPVLLMSAFADEGIHRRARDLGAPVFDKPFDVDDLRTCIGHMLERERGWRPKRSGTQKRRVLVADDDHELRRLLVAELGKLDCEVEEAASGLALVDRLADDELEVAPFALVVTDVRMPGVTGMSVLRSLRGADSPRHAGTPVLLMTAFGDDATRAEARHLGAILLDKPFELDELRMWARLLIEEA